MRPRILIIDDQPAWLEPLIEESRNATADGTSPQFALDIASSGAEALKLIRGGGQFASILISNPLGGMDPLETIKSCRKLLPECVFIMMADVLETGIVAKAVNEASVFRLLLLPCDLSIVKEALIAAIDRYQTESAQQCLIEESFVGSVGLISQILDLTDNGFVDTSTILETMESVAVSTGMQVSWDERVAARLCLGGLPLLDSADRHNILLQPINAPAHIEAMERLCEASASMMAHIPRLTTSAKIMRHIPRCDGTTSVSLSRDLKSATLLRASILWSLLTHKGIPGSLAAQELKLVLPELTDTFFNAFLSLDDRFEELKAVEVAVDDLEPGMVVYADVENELGAVLVSQGKRITEQLIERLQAMRDSGEIASVEIVAASSTRLLEQLSS